MRKREQLRDALLGQKSMSNALFHSPLTNSLKILNVHFEAEVGLRLNRMSCKRIDNHKPIEPNEIQLWWASIAAIASLGEHYLTSHLGEQEAQSLNGLPSPRRHEFLATRVWIRALLSHYQPLVMPNKWEFDSNAYGKPNVDCDLNGHRLDFNLSHSNGLIICAFRLDHPVGVDIEVIRLLEDDWVDIARTCFSPREVIELMSHRKDDIPRRFTQYWTLKEAFIKAVGTGLSMPLKDFSMIIPSLEAIDSRLPTVSFTPKISENSANWRFQLLETAPGFQAAIAAKSDCKQKLFVTQMGEFSMAADEVSLLK